MLLDSVEYFTDHDQPDWCLVYKPAAHASGKTILACIKILNHVV